MGRRGHRARRAARCRCNGPGRWHPVRPAVREPAQPRRAVDRPPGLEDRPRRRGRPPLVRLPVAADVCQRAVPGVARPPVVPHGPHRRHRPRPGRGRGRVVARATRVRHAERGHRRRGDGRGLHGPCGLFAGRGDRRPAHARGRRRPRVDGSGTARARRHRGRPRDRLQVSGRVPGRAARGRRLAALVEARGLVDARGSRVLRVEPVHARPPASGLARPVPRPTPGTRRLARVRARSHRPDRVRRPALGRSSGRHLSSACSGSSWRSSAERASI